MIDAAGSSQVPAFGLAGTLVAAVILLAGAAWFWRRGARGVSAWSSTAALTGLAAALVTVFVAGMRHYGPRVDTGSGRTQSACSVWWTEAGLPSGQQATQGDYSSSCHHDALAAIGPAVLVAVLVGLAVAVLVFALMLFRGRRRHRTRVHVGRGRVIE